MYFKVLKQCQAENQPAGWKRRAGRQALKFDLDLYAGGELQAHQGLHGLLGGGHDVDQALVGAALELLPAVLVLVDGALDGDDLLLGGQGDGAGDPGVGALGGLDDGLGGLVDQLVIVSLEADADHFLCCHECFLQTNFVLRRVAPPIGTVRSFQQPNRAYQTRTEKQTGFAGRSPPVPTIYA